MKQWINIKITMLPETFRSVEKKCLTIRSSDSFKFSPPNTDAANIREIETWLKKMKIKPFRKRIEFSETHYLIHERNAAIFVLLFC